jgi:T5SS/PEP-CTERM-associated repeat protein
MRKLALVIVLVTCVVPTRASVITTGDVDPGGAATQLDPWTVGGDLKVGRYGNGTLNVEAGGAVSNAIGYLGYQTGSAGEARVTGEASEWNNTGPLRVGYQGDGTLHVEGGGVVSNAHSSIGTSSSSTGMATVTGASSRWTNSSNLYVGSSGNGTLNVEAGGVVSNTYGHLGYNVGSTGEATVTGPGSQWSNSNSLFIGGNGSQARGTGTLNLADRGLVTVSSTTKLWSTGTINQDGGNLTTGSFDNTDLGTLNFHDGTLTVNGAGGVFNPGTADFTIDGNVITDLPELVVANTATATLSGDLRVGNANQGALTVEAGGAVDTFKGYIGKESGSTGIATVSGSGSQWNNSNLLYVGHDGNGTLNVTDGGVVSSSVINFIGLKAGSMGQATVTGIGSRWSSSRLDIGEFGNGTLNVESGGVVTNSMGWLGVYDGATGTVTVTGTDSRWNNSEILRVGWDGNGILNIEADGVVSNTDGYLGVESGSTGVATVTGANSQWNNSGDLVVGYLGDATLNVEAGGVVSNTEGYIGTSSSSTGIATVTDSGSQWNNSSNLYVGSSGNGTLNVEAGGVVSNTIGYIGEYQSSTGAATVTGSGSRWNSSGGLHVGGDGSGTLNVEAGGVVSISSWGLLGHQSGSTGVATITGSGSQWTNSSYLSVGYAGDGTLNVTDEGEVSNTSGYIGYYPPSTGAATVSGAGSTWTNAAELYVGREGTGTLNIEVGGVVSNTKGYIAEGAGSTGVATVTGSGSQWNNSSDLSVGYEGTGTLNVEAGGVVSNTKGYIGDESGSTGVATVTGANSQWNNSGRLYVGDGGSGTLNIADDGLVTVGGTTSIGATGTVNLTGGRFEFGQTTLVEFSTINATGGALAGNVTITGVNNVASLTALQNSVVDLNDVVAVNEGLLHGSAILNSSLANQVNGEVETMAGARMQFRGAGNTSAGELNNFGGQIRFDQDMINESSGFIGGRGQFVADGGWTNSGLMAFSGTTDILGDVVNDTGGQIVTSGGATTTIFDDLEHNGAEIRTSAGSRTVIFGAASGSGAYTGSGDVFFEGDLRPGNSPGQVSFGGNVVLGTTARLESELLGTAAGSEHDQLAITGTVNLDGTLDVVPLAPYADPDAHGTADDFVIITAGDRRGTFSTVQYDGSPLGADSATDGNGSFRSHTGGGLFRSVTYTATTVQLQNLLALAGDTDGDMDIDLSDYNTITTNFDPIGTHGPYPWLAGNFDGDGDVDLADYNTLAGNFHPAGYGAAAVPEPAAVILSLLAALLVSASGRLSVLN